MDIMLLTYDDLCELARPSRHNHRNIVYIQFRDEIRKITHSDYYRVNCCYLLDETYDKRGKPFHLERMGRGKRYGHDQGIKRNTYGKEWRAFLLLDAGAYEQFDWEDEQ